MIKKYLLNQNSVFTKSLILSLFEPHPFGFEIEGLTDKDIKHLFNVNKNIFKQEDIDLNKVPTKGVAVYLEDDLSLKAIVMKSPTNLYYLFKADPQKENKLNIHQKYISKDLDSLLEDYEKHLKTKGKSNYAGIGDISIIDNIDYFEKLYELDIDKKINKKSPIYKLLFTSNNLFVVDFVELVNHNQIKIINKYKINDKALTFESMQKHRINRKDCLFIDSETKDIKYFVFTYKPHFINHYILLKYIGNDEFEFIMETISFNKILSSNELKDITYRNGSEFATKQFAKRKYDNFYLEYLAFEEEEEFDEEVKENLPEIVKEQPLVNKEQLLLEVNRLLPLCKSSEVIGVTLHGKSRILERIGNLNDEEIYNLSKVAYEHGKTSVHYLEKDPLMFRFLQYQQNKIQHKTLRFFKDILFFYSMEAPHDLVTCFLYQNNYDKYVEVQNKKNKKK